MYDTKRGDTSLAAVAWGIKAKLKPGKYTPILKAHHDMMPKLMVPNMKVPREVAAPPFNLDIKYKLNVE